MSEYLCRAGEATPNCKDCDATGIVREWLCGETERGMCGTCGGSGRRTLTGPENRLQSVRLALAAPFGQGAEERDVMDLAAAVVGELLELRQRYDDLTVSLENLSSVASMIPDAARKAKWTTLPTSGLPVLEVCDG